MSCLWFTCDVTSCHYNSASTVETLNHTRVNPHQSWLFFGVSNVIRIPTHCLQTGLLSTGGLVQRQHSHKFQREKWWEARPRRPSTIEHGDVCRCCCNQRAHELVVLPGYLLALGAENVMEPQVQIALVPSINLGTGEKSQGTDFWWKKSKLQPHLQCHRVTVLVLFTSKTMCCLPYR